MPPRKAPAPVGDLNQSDLTIDKRVRVLEQENHNLHSLNEQKFQRIVKARELLVKVAAVLPSANVTDRTRVLLEVNEWLHPSQ